MNFPVPQNEEISWLADGILACQEGLWSMDFVKFWVTENKFR